MTERDEYQGLVPAAVAPCMAGGVQQFANLLRGQMFAGAYLGILSTSRWNFPIFGDWDWPPVIRVGFGQPPGDDEPSSLRLWQALRAVCAAAEAVAADDSNYEEDFLGVATAAAILSGMLEDRLVIVPLAKADES